MTLIQKILLSIFVGEIPICILLGIFYEECEPRNFMEQTINVLFTISFVLGLLSIFGFFVSSIWI